MYRPTRTETDSLGELTLPADAYYGVQTARAVANFPISGRTLPPGMIRAVARIKHAGASTHEALGQLEPRLAEAIRRAADEVIAGKLDAHFVVDVFQAGAGTSFHMNVNEVIANRANEALGANLGTYAPIHPNDHVNMGQSTNDVIPTAIRLAAIEALPGLLAALDGLAGAFEARAAAFAHVIKAGRTHLQDAVPVTLGQELGAYARTIRRAHARITEAARDLHALGLGGSAAGTGLNTLPAYRDEVVRRLVGLTGAPLLPAPDLFEAMQSLAPVADLSAALRGLALEVTRIVNDLRLLASGPRTGLAELILPAVQPGSSIMPGKINPSIPEMVNQVCFHVLGNDAAIAFATQAGQLELNVMMPMVAHNLLESLTILTNALGVLDARCVRGLEADEDRCRGYALGSVAIATVLNPLVGYQRAAEVVKQALREDRPVVDVVVERGFLTPDQAAAAFAPDRLTTPGKLEAP